MHKGLRAGDGGVLARGAHWVWLKIMLFSMEGTLLLDEPGPGLCIKEEET